jgi:hypothetical protein
MHADAGDLPTPLCARAGSDQHREAEKHAGGQRGCHRRGVNFFRRSIASRLDGVDHPSDQAVEDAVAFVAGCYGFLLPPPERPH